MGVLLRWRGWGRQKLTVADINVHVVFCLPHEVAGGGGEGSRWWCSLVFHVAAQVIGDGHRLERTDIGAPRVADRNSAGRRAEGRKRESDDLAHRFPQIALLSSQAQHGSVIAKMRTQVRL